MQGRLGRGQSGGSLPLEYLKATEVNSTDSEQVQLCTYSTPQKYHFKRRQCCQTHTKSKNLLVSERCKQTFDVNPDKRPSPKGRISAHIV